MAHADTLSPELLRSRVLRSIGWRLVSQALLQGSRILVVVLLARLLTPREYGIAGMVLVFTSFVLPFADLGLGAALVQRPRLRAIDLSTVFWTSLAAGAAFTLLGVALAGPLASFYGEPEVRALFAAFSTGFLLASLATVHRSLLVREINFRSLELRLLAATFVSSALAIWAAASGYGAWALIIQNLVATGLSTVLYWTSSRWRPSLAFSLASLRDLGGFGIKALGARVLNDLRFTADKFLVGRFLGAAPLGLYTVANNVVLLPFNRIVTPLQDVLFPAFSRVQDERARLASVWIRANRALAAVSAPLMFGMIVLAPEFVAIVLGERWRAATTLLQILGWIGLVQALQGLVPSVLQACDRPGLLLRFTFASFLASLVAFVVGVRWGVVGVAASLAVVSTLLFPVAIWLATRLLGLSLMRVARSLVGVAQASVGMVAVLIGARLALVDAGMPAGARFAVLVVLGAVSYGVFIRWRDGELVHELRSLRTSPRETAAQAAV